MLVAHELKLIYAHVPKTGGSSVTAALRPYLKCRVPENRIQPPGTKGWQSQWHELGGMQQPRSVVQNELNPLIADGYRIAVGIRSPYERLASMWAIKGRTADLSPFSYIQSYLPEHCKYTVMEMAGAWIDYQLRFDSLQEDWQSMCSELDIELDLPKENDQGFGQGGDVQVLMSDPDCVEWIETTFHDEFEAFGFERAMPERRDWDEPYDCGTGV